MQRSPRFAAGFFSIPARRVSACQGQSTGYPAPMQRSTASGTDAADDLPVVPIEVPVRIEIPRGSFLKRGSSGRIDFVSPLPCPFNYGSVPTHIGLEGDLLDAVVLGPRLPAGTELRALAWGAVTLTDRGMSDDKLICCATPLLPGQRHEVLRFFRFYACCKGWLNVWRRRPGRNACDGWIAAEAALARSRPRGDDWRGPPVEF